MQNIDVRNKLHLRWTKVIVCVFAFLLFSEANAQRFVEINNPNYDGRKFSYGFLIGLHSTSYQLKYSDKFISNDLDSLHSILPYKSPGFSLGFLVNFRLSEFFDLRLTPKVAFYEHTLEYNFIDESQIIKLKESTIVEFPMVVRYKSNRRENTRMFLSTGIMPGIEASGKNDLQGGLESLNIQRFNLSAEFGVGFDLYFPLFKFSPELRYSKGLLNVLSNDPSNFSEGISRLSTNTLHLYFIFQ